MIEAKNLHKSFGTLKVLRGASLRVEEGQVIALIGGSGDGKTVFLKHLARLLQPDEGHVFFEGKDISRLHGKKLEKLRGRLGFLFQGGALFESMTVYDNIAFPLRECTRMSENEIRGRVLEELENVGLLGSEEKYPAQISGGMAKRAALARSLVQSPKVMLFDEPTTGLDPIIVHSIHDLIASLQERLGLTAIIVSHRIPNIFAIVDKVAMLHEGVMRFVGTPEEVLECDDQPVRKFIEGSMPPERYWRPAKMFRNLPGSSEETQ